MDDKIKYLLLAVGAWFAYDWYTNKTPAGGVDYTKMSAGELDAAFRNPSTSATDRGTITALLGNLADRGNKDALVILGRPGYTSYPEHTTFLPSAVTPPVVSGNVSVLAGMTNDQIAAFASQGNQDAVTLANSRGLRYNHHQWNYFRALALGEQPDPELWAPGHTTEAVTATAYLAARAAVGMAGMGWMPVLPWSTAWQA